MIFLGPDAILETLHGFVVLRENGRCYGRYRRKDMAGWRLAQVRDSQRPGKPKVKRQTVPPWDRRNTPG